MRWFKHLTASGTDPDIGAIMDEFGFIGYFLFFRTLEVMSIEFDEENPGKNEFNFNWFLNQFPRNVGRKKILTFLNFCQGSLKKKRIIYSLNGSKIFLNCPKLKELTDDYTTRLIRSKSEVNPNIVRSNSEKNPSHRNKNIEDRNKNKEKSPKYKFSDAHFEIAKYFETKIKERLPRHKFTGKDYLQSWANTVRLMEEKKEATTTEIITLINWISIDSFWFKNILSMETLREKFGRLWADMEGTEPKRNMIGQSQQKPTKEQEEFYQAREKKLDELNERYRPEFEQAKKDADMKAIGQIDNKIKEELAEWSREYWKGK